MATSKEALTRVLQALKDEHSRSLAETADIQSINEGRSEGYRQAIRFAQHVVLDVMDDYLA